MKRGAIVVAGAVTAAAAELAPGRRRWKRKTAALRAAMRTADVPSILTAYDRRPLNWLRTDDPSI